MLDLVIEGGLVVDGTGTQPVRADVGIKSGRIVAFGDVSEPAQRSLSADGLVVSPGFVDPHTHYDAQLFWDPLATPSSWHGVTTVIGGNCGFTLAPLRQHDADYIRRMMAQVEGMPLGGLELGVPWGWDAFGEYLDSLDGHIGVNAGFLVGHSALRRYVLGEDFGREASESERGRMVELLDQSLTAGGLGLSTSRSSTHTDGAGDPVPSRWASEEELYELCEVVGRHDGMSLALITDGCINRFSDEEVEYLASLSVVADSPINWNALGVSSADPGRIEHQLRPSRRARELGGRIMALTMPVHADNNMSLLTFCGFWHIPGWRAVLDLEVPDRIRRLQDPAVRADLLDKARASRWAYLVDFEHYTIGDVYSQSNEVYRNRSVGEIAAQRGEDPFTTLVGIAVADELRTVLWPRPFADLDADWVLRSAVWQDPDVLLGGSDAGAHLDRMLGSPYPTRFVADCLRGRQLLPMERAVQLMTDVPARLFGLRHRGRLAVGYHADVVVFDPERVGAGPSRTCHDLPGNGKRLVADPLGVAAVPVNGRQTIADGQPTGDLPGALLRSGRDTTTAAR